MFANPPPPSPAPASNAVPTSFQEQELRELLAAASIVDSSEDAQRTGTCTSAPAACQVETNQQQQQQQQPRSVAVAVADCPPPLSVGAAAETETVAVPDSHPVLEMYRSIGEPLDPMSFEELKRRVGTAVEEVGCACLSLRPAGQGYSLKL